MTCWQFWGFPLKSFCWEHDLGFSCCYGEYGSKEDTKFQRSALDIIICLNPGICGRWQFARSRTKRYLWCETRMWWIHDRWFLLMFFYCSLLDRSEKWWSFLYLAGLTIFKGEYSSIGLLAVSYMHQVIPPVELWSILSLQLKKSSSIMCHQSMILFGKVSYLRIAFFFFLFLSLKVVHLEIAADWLYLLLLSMNWINMYSSFTLTFLCRVRSRECIWLVW